MTSQLSAPEQWRIFLPTPRVLNSDSNSIRFLNPWQLNGHWIQLDSESINLKWDRLKSEMWDDHAIKTAVKCNKDASYSSGFPRRCFVISDFHRMSHTLDLCQDHSVSVSWRWIQRQTRISVSVNSVNECNSAVDFKIQKSFLFFSSSNEIPKKKKEKRKINNWAHARTQIRNADFKILHSAVNHQKVAASCSIWNDRIGNVAAGGEQTTAPPVLIDAM